jgi:hypothetical protein
VATDNSLLAVAAALGAAAYLLAQDTADAASDDSTVSNSNGFAINNPGNIEYSSANNWVGQTGQHNGYVVFDTLANGVRAMGILLGNYYAAGATTITAIISRWAPPANNNTPAYIAAVAAQMGDDANEPLSWPQDEVPMIQAIAMHENGYNNMADADVQSYLVSS